jgi:type I restriction enzyme S subunit
LETQIVIGSGGIANNIPRGGVKAFLAAPLPEQEQAELATIPRDEVAKLDQLTETGEIAMTLLQERRAALIVAAVTGKIDMRGFVHNQTETA